MVLSGGVVWIGVVRCLLLLLPTMFLVLYLFARCTHNVLLLPPVLYLSGPLDRRRHSLTTHPHTLARSSCVLFLVFRVCHLLDRAT
jgi:hypothetical protein